MWLWIKATIIGVAKIILLLIAIAVFIFFAGIVLGVISILGSSLLTTYPVIETILIAFAILITVLCVVITLASIVSDEHDNLKEGE